MDPILKLVNLSIGQESVIVDSIHAQAFKNDLIVLTGENGSGPLTNEAVSGAAGPAIH